MRLSLALVGFGHVGRRFAALLGERQARIERETGAVCRIVGIATRRHGAAFDPEGVDVERALALVADGRPLDPLHDARLGAPPAPLELMAALQRHRLPGPVLIETTPLGVPDGRPAVDHVAAALDAGIHVVTANKGPAAFAWRRLRGAAAASGASFLFEGAVMDGVPVFSLVRETLPAVGILGFRGVLNSTTNHLLTAIEAGRGFEEALAEMQAAGVAEADPSHDLEGWDAAAKTAALVNVLMDGDVTPHRIERAAVTPDTAERVRAAASRGRRLKVVASAEQHDGGIAAAVRLIELPAGDWLASLDGMANGLVLKTDLLGEVAIGELEGGLTQTAYALLADVITVARRLQAPRADPARRSRPRPDRR